MGKRVAWHIKDKQDREHVTESDTAFGACAALGITLGDVKLVRQVDTKPLSLESDEDCAR